MRAGQAGIVLGVIGILALGVVLLVSGTPTCGCGMMPAKSLSLEPAEGAYRVQAATPGLRYADVGVAMDGQLLPWGPGGWSAERDGRALAREDAVLAADVLHLPRGDGVVHFVDVEANSVMLTLDPARPR